MSLGVKNNMKILYFHGGEWNVEKGVMGLHNLFPPEMDLCLLVFHCAMYIRQGAHMRLILSNAANFSQKLPVTWTVSNLC
jgi:hypothetical protein